MADRKAQLAITADASGVEAGVAKAKRSIASIGHAATAAGKEASAGLGSIGDGAAPATAKVERAMKQLIGSMERVTFATEAGGRGTSRYFELLAQQKGINPDGLRKYLDALDAANAKQAAANPLLGASTKALNAYGQTAGQTAQALRQVPAQLTDIITSLQGGQAPLTVFLQQGGQLRDVFGGIAPAAKALGGAVLGLINPLTITAAAAAALAFAYNAGTKESDVYARALILSGNAAGVTVSQLDKLAASVSNVAGTQGKAAEVLAQLASTGQVGAAALGKVTLAAIQLERAGGKAVADTVKEFAALGKDPVDAAVKLNEQYNFLTLSTFEQIKALKEQGRATEAAALAQNAFADAILGRAGEIEKRLGNFEKLWRDIKDSALGAADAVVGFFRKASPDSEIANLERLASGIEANRGRSLTSEVADRQLAPLRERIALLKGEADAGARAAASQAQVVAASRAGIAAEQEISRIREQSRTKQQQLNGELKKYRENIEAVRKANPASALLDPVRIAADEAAIRLKFKGSAPAAVRDDAAVRMLQTLRETEAVTRAQLSVDEKLTASERQRAEFEQLIADLKDKKILTADQKSLSAAREAIRLQLDRNVAVEKEVVARDKATKELERQRKELERFQEAAAQIGSSLASANQGRSEQFDATLQVAGRGSEARERLQAQIGIEREFQRARERLDRATPKELLGSDVYTAEVVKIKALLGDALAANEQYFSDLKRLQADWSIGANRAYEDYVSAAQNAAERSEQFFSSAFGRLEDGLADFLATGKLDIKGFADFIVSELARATAKNLLASAAESVKGSTDGIVGFIGKTLGGFFGGAQGAGDGGAAVAATARASADTLAAAAISTASASSAVALLALSTAAAGAATALASVALSGAASSGGSALKTLFDGFRADGGPVAAGRLYRVNERGPEVLDVGGRQFLMMGAQGGTVAANRTSERPVVANISIPVSGAIDRRTAEQLAAAATRGFIRAASRRTAG